MTSSVKDAGVYHLATGTWQRHTGSSALVGPNQLYDNTCTVGYYALVADGGTAADSGRTPSTDHGGLADCYEITCFSLAYCTFEPVVTTLGVAYYDCYAACDGLTSASPIVTYTLVNVPGGGSAGTQGCWIVTFDLTNTTLTWNLAGNADGTFDNVPSTDNFGWSWTQLIPTTGSDAGPLLSGDPLGLFSASCGLAVSATGQGAGTDHPGWGGSSGPGTGIGSDLDQYELNGGGMTGCFWFGGYNSSASANPLGAFYHKLWGTPSSGGCAGCDNAENQGSPYCFGSTGNCPGGVVGDVEAGCPHQAGPNGAHGAVLTPTGDANFNNDTYGFYVSAGPSSLGILIQGSSAVAYPNGNANVPDSAGLFCVAPQQRGVVEFMNLGAGSDEGAIDDFKGLPFSATAQPSGSTTYNQFWFRDTGNPHANPGSGSEFNFSNAVETNWVGTGATSLAGLEVEEADSPFQFGNTRVVNINVWWSNRKYEKVDIYQNGILVSTYNPAANCPQNFTKATVYSAVVTGRHTWTVTFVPGSCTPPGPPVSYTAQNLNCPRDLFESQFPFPLAPPLPWIAGCGSGGSFSGSGCILSTPEGLLTVGGTTPCGGVVTYSTSGPGCSVASTCRIDVNP